MRCFTTFSLNDAVANVVPDRQGIVHSQLNTQCEHAACFHSTFVHKDTWAFNSFYFILFFYILSVIVYTVKPFSKHVGF